MMSSCGKLQLPKFIVVIFNAGIIGAANHNTGNVITMNDMSSTGANRLRRGGMLAPNHNGLQVSLNRIGGILDQRNQSKRLRHRSRHFKLFNDRNNQCNIINSIVFKKIRIIGVTNTSAVGLSAVGIGVAGGPSGANTISNNMSFRESSRLRHIRTSSPEFFAAGQPLRIHVSVL